MMSSAASLTYRRAALQQASTVGLVIALYDTLAGDLARAAAAIEANDIETRCKELKHGFKVLQQLDAMLNMKDGGQAAIDIRRFYTHVRGQMLAAQFKLSPLILRDQIRILIDVRGAWQQLDSRGQAAAPHTPAGETLSQGVTAPSGSKPSSFSCSG